MLDFSYLSDQDGSKSSLVLNDKKAQLLDHAFTYLRQKTGIMIDPYGQTRIYPDHQKILINLLHQHNDSEIQKLVLLFKQASSEDEIILADGD
ncbi:hypothetical protein A9G29_03295 [Gilliamella sp. Fer2-1]|jgi:hypothetical protein|uniref:hypothetical protein n=1 Tax=unclassified Gilliamella TaxID=2685620 RepID=UPI00080E210A|nr:hypothetical protein [Gilliamella apicola]OCG19405.1 hypothetical protein A9G47_03930 [Gilliamella apicola]OCG26447.1 hypothetical protein A9G46_04845 [Gilliamella apicola]OCG30695.1 hypothetical protein A9G45_02230 [Gilliamella apicola]OCG34342.1 hypothetical protein A9G29_03295 [Gilliamella apicola]OCG58082.1 hypothetical protein A9G40_10935 [Gilliamella apicola]